MTRRRRQALLDVVVTQVVRGQIKDLDQFNLDARTMKSSVYYVRARVRHQRGGDVSGERLPLYAAVSKTLVVPPVTFGSAFKRCDDQPLPAPFNQARQVSLCQVFLAPNKGRVTEIQWRVADDSLPISWRAR